jgi:hypothetical protein
MKPRCCGLCRGTGHYATTCELNDGTYIAPKAKERMRKRREKNQKQEFVAFSYDPVERIAYLDQLEQSLLAQMKQATDDLITMVAAKITKPGYPGFEK